MTSTPLTSSTSISNSNLPARESLPAGGEDFNQFNCKEVWYPLHYVKDLDKSKPIAFTLLGEDLVIWWEEKTATWRVLLDQCPHRLARLSEGRINEQGLLECPYHGWTFTGLGTCTTIPQQILGTNAEKSPRACVKSLPTTIRQGLLFAYPGNPENATKVKVPIVDVLENASDDWVCIDTFRDLPYDALTLLENVLDTSHVSYTHHGTVGNRKNAAPVELEIVESNRQGFKGRWEEGPRKGTLGPQDTTFIAPNLMWHDLQGKTLGRTLTVVYATPIRKGECRIFARFPFKFNSKIPRLFIKLTPRWYSHLNQNSILEDDQIFLHYQERYLEALGGSENFTKACYLPTKSDNFVNSLRQWVNQYHAEPFSNQSFSPALNQKQLLERYYSHTVKCGSCYPALIKLKKVRIVLAIITGIIWSISPLLTVIFNDVNIIFMIILTVISLLTGGSWLKLGQIEKKFHYGEPIPSRNKS